MSDHQSTTFNYFETLYARAKDTWGSAASDLAVEAAALLRTLRNCSDLKVLDLCCGDGRDSLYFASQGWHVTAVDRSEEALRKLTAKAEEMGLSHKIKIIQGNVTSMKYDDMYDLVYSNYSLHFLDSHQRRDVLAHLMKITSPQGLHALLAIRDLNDEVVGDVKDYRYLQTGELERQYRSWKPLDTYNGFYPDEHPGFAPHHHSVSIIVAQKSAAALASRFAKIQPYLSKILLALCCACLSTILCAIGYDNLTAGSIANVWAGGIFNTPCAAALGGWGIVASVMAGIITNAINVGTLYSVVGFIPANFIQTFIPAWYYRRVLKKGGWHWRTFRFLPFVIYGVVIPNVLGALWGASIIHLYGNGPFIMNLVKWLLANIPIALVMGWPLFRVVVPALVDEGWTVKGWWK